MKKKTVLLSQGVFDFLRLIVSNFNCKTFEQIRTAFQNVFEEPHSYFPLFSQIS